jgi:hypothetical protein
MTNNNHPTTEKLLAELQERIERDRQFLAQGEAVLASWKEHLREAIAGQRESEAAGGSSTSGQPA